VTGGGSGIGGGAGTGVSSLPPPPQALILSATANSAMDEMGSLRDINFSKLFFDFSLNRVLRPTVNFTLNFL
jgi:hypothetical protein